jgi:sigma-B regulation protein RsbU (phosphoserine phosphatase)
MLRMAFRLGASLETAFVHVNNQLADILPGDRFITAFIGLLDPATHRMRFHSGGQGPILHFHAARGEFTHYMPTSFPLAAMPLATLRQPAIGLAMEPGDILALISDGIFEYEAFGGEQFGEKRVRDFIIREHGSGMRELAAKLFAEVKGFAKGAPQEDDMTVVLVKRT